MIAGVGLILNSVLLVIVGITLGFAVIDAKSWYIPRGHQWAWERDDDLEEVTARHYKRWLF